MGLFGLFRLMSSFKAEHLTIFPSYNSTNSTIKMWYKSHDFVFVPWIHIVDGLSVFHYLIVLSHGYTIKGNHMFWSLIYGTIHLRSQQIFKIFDPYPGTIGTPVKCLWRRFLCLMYCNLLTIGKWGHPFPLKTCWRPKWMVPMVLHAARMVPQFYLKLDLCKRTKKIRRLCALTIVGSLLSVL